MRQPFSLEYHLKARVGTRSDHYSWQYTIKKNDVFLNLRSAYGWASNLIVVLPSLPRHCGAINNKENRYLRYPWHFSYQVLPFLALGLGVDDMFLLAHSYSSLTQSGDIRNKASICSLSAASFLTLCLKKMPQQVPTFIFISWHPTKVKCSKELSY